MAAYQKDGSGPLGMVPLVSAFLPCPDFPQEQRAQLLQQIEGTAKTAAQKKQYEVLRQILQDPAAPNAHYIFAPFQILPKEGPSPKGIFGMGHPGHFIIRLKDQLESIPLADCS